MMHGFYVKDVKVLRILQSFEESFPIKAIPLIASTCQTRPWFAYATNLGLPTSL